MAGALTTKAGAPARRLSAWRIVTWLVLLLAAFGLITQLRAVLLITGAMGQAAAEDADGLRMAMAWAVGYLLITLAVAAVALATLRRREWGRRTMRAIAVVLALWAAWTAGGLIGQWHDMQAVLSQPGMIDPIRINGERIQRIFLVGAALKLVSIPIFAWLAWVLGRPAVRGEFHR
jgi:hypothetical protein